MFIFVLYQTYFAQIDFKDFLILKKSINDVNLEYSFHCLYFYSFTFLTTSIHPIIKIFLKSDDYRHLYFVSHKETSTVSALSELWV